MVDFDDLGVLGLGLGVAWVRGQGTGADIASRQNIFAESDRDLLRQRARDAEPDDRMRWRFHQGAWQRWSDLDRAFATMSPPGTLLEHVEAAGGPVEDQELVFDGDSWELADDLAEEAERPEAADDDAPAPAADVWRDASPPPPSPPPSPAPPPPPPPPPGGAPARDAADFEAQLEAWRRRR